MTSTPSRNPQARMARGANILPAAGLAAPRPAWSLLVLALLMGLSIACAVPAFAQAAAAPAAAGPATVPATAPATATTPAETRSPQVGDATRALLAAQARGASASPTPRPIAGDVAQRSYDRYLKSFEYPIPESLASTVVKSGSDSR